MSYKSPIDIIMGQMNISYENEICKAVQNLNICVEKEELIKALRYDREQYEKGYADRDSEIVRCKDCIFGYISKFAPPEKRDIWCCARNHILATVKPDFFCADGERKEGEQE